MAKKQKEEIEVLNDVYIDKIMYIKAVVRGYYVSQRLRIPAGMNLVNTFRSRLGLKPTTPETEGPPESEKILNKLRAQYEHITKEVVSQYKNYTKTNTGNNLITSWVEYDLVGAYLDLYNSERRSVRALEEVLKDFPIYTEWLSGIKGVGPVMAGVLISEIDISKAKYASSLWKYAGLDVAPDGRGRGRWKDHLVPKTYTNSKGKVTETQGITYNPFLKSRLMGVLAEIFVKNKGRGSKYGMLYDQYKHRLENHAIYKDEVKKRRHLMACRYCVKIFLADLYEVWRPLEGLPVYKPYHEEKLGYPPHGQDPEQAA